MVTTDIFRVDGLVALITGAGSGLGRMMAHALATNGASKIYILGRRLEKLQETAKDHANIIPIQADVTDKASLKAAADRIKAEVGYINLLVVNSGASGPFATLPQSGSIVDLQEYFWTYSTEELNQVFALNNTAGFFTLVTFLELLAAGNEKQNQPGIHSSVVFTASIAGYARALATGVAYIASKAATIQSTKMYSTLLARWNIRVNAIAPGLYPSEMTTRAIANPKIVDTIPAHRFGSEEDMAGLILFLASRAGAYINGDVILTDGGRLGQMPASF